MMLLPGLVQPSENLQEDLASVRQVTMLQLLLLLTGRHALLGTPASLLVTQSGLSTDSHSCMQSNEAALAQLDELAQQVATTSQQHSTPLFPSPSELKSEATTLSARALQAAERLTAARQQTSVSHTRAQLEAIAQVRPAPLNPPNSPTCRHVSTFAGFAAVHQADWHDLQAAVIVPWLGPDGGDCIS